MSGGFRFEVDLDLGKLEHVREVTPEALGEAMEHIRGVAVSLTPVETGRLAGSATVRAEGDKASITYDGPYARYQHEGLNLRHEHGQAKFLEQPLSTEAQKALEIIARRLGESL